MKKFLVGMAVASTLILGMAGSVFASKTLTFTWNQNTEPDMMSYRLYQSAQSGNYTFGAQNAVKEINKQFTTTSLSVPDGEWFFVLTAVDTSNNESGPSTEVSPGRVDGTPPTAPGGFNVTVTVIVNP